MKLEVKPKNDLEGYVGSALDYAVYQELGTNNMHAQPYLRPAVDLVLGGKPADEVIQAINNGVYDEIKRGSKHIEKKGNATFTKNGDTMKGVNIGTSNGIIKACINVTSQAKLLSPVDKGGLRNSIMWKVGSKEGGYQPVPYR